MNETPKPGYDGNAAFSLVERAPTPVYWG